MVSGHLVRGGLLVAVIGCAGCLELAPGAARGIDQAAQDESRKPRVVEPDPVEPCEQYLRGQVSRAPGQPEIHTVRPEQCPTEVKCRSHVLGYRDAPSVELAERWREMPAECHALSASYRHDHLLTRQLCREAIADIRSEPDATTRQRLMAELSDNCRATGR